MSKNKQALYEELTLAGIFGPNSDEIQRQEKFLLRYFEKEYRNALQNPRSLKMLGVITDRGPIAEQIKPLMDKHYDTPADFFTGFLDKNYAAYSMAYYGDTPACIRASRATLEDAQRAKFSLIAERAQIAGYESIINIGCGFGSLETYLLQTFPKIEITGLTPSKVQINYLRKRMQDPADPLASGRFTVIETDFEKFSPSALERKKFDIVLSIGVFEHMLNLHAALERIAGLLVPNGKTFHHFITSQLPIPKFLEPQKTRIGKYFPGGRVWPHDELPRHTEHFDLVNSWFVNGLNYWRTLNEWHQRYWNSIPDLYGAVFDIGGIKYWNEYFSLCKAMFAPMDGEFYGNSHYLFQLKD